MFYLGRKNQLNVNVNVNYMSFSRENMDQFVLGGIFEDGSLKQLRIPIKKIFDVRDQSILSGESEDISCDQGLNDKRFPYRAPETLRDKLFDLAMNDQMFRGHRDVYPRMLEYVYSKHRFPLAQGPAIPPIDKVN